MAFAHAARVVDVRNVSCTHYRTEEFYFVYFADKIGGWDRLMLANEERLGVG
jgi:hypothetical protein